MEGYKNYILFINYKIMVESTLASKVELFICARNLANMDTFSLSDPYCTVMCLNPQSGQYYEIGRTETIKNNLNPN